MFPLNILLIIFLVFVLIVGLFTFFNTYHMVKYGKAGALTIGITTVYLLTVGAFLVTSLVFMTRVNWSQSISLSDLFEPSSPTLFP